jgi:GH25 family lysozyme M1 (1,4-beta-N-acetylmuramidase)
MAVGMDISPRYQRGINWSNVDYSDDGTRGVRYCWVKVSDGGASYSWFDSLGVRYDAGRPVAGAKSRGIPVGGYHYAQLSPSPETQADLLVGEVRRWGALGVAPMLDLEAPFKPDGFAKDFGIRFCKRVAAAGLRPAVYMSASDARILRPDQWGIPGLVIVIARYGGVPEAPGSGQYLGRYDVHQYSSSGTRGGVNVDLDDSRNSNHLTAVAPLVITGGFVSGFNAADFSNLMWGNVFDTNGNRNFAKFIKDMDEVLRDTNADTAAVVAALNALGAQLAQVFTTINAKLDQIIANQGDEPSAAVQQKSLAAVDELAAPSANPEPANELYAIHEVPPTVLEAAGDEAPEVVQ